VITSAPGAETHPVLRGVKIDALRGNGGLYHFGPLAPDATALLNGTVPGKPSASVAWTHRYGEKRAPIFYVALGDPLDFENAEFRRLLVNAIEWGLAR
jgi:hypothetical protein